MIDPDLSPVRSNEKIERVLSNLLANALRHTPASGSITIAAKAQGTQTLVAVEDKRAWHQPRRHNSASSTASGAPINHAQQPAAASGLAIAKGLIDAQGRTIWAEKRSTGGACIAFTLTTTPT